MRQLATISLTVLLLTCVGACTSDDDGSEPIGSTTPPEAEMFCTSGPASFDSVATVLDSLEPPLRAIAAGQYGEAVAPVKDVYVGLDEARETLSALKDSAPADISGSVTTMTDAFIAVLDAFPPEDEFVSALESGEGAQVQAVLAEIETFQTTATEAFSTAEVRDAGQSVRDYVAANCNSAPSSTQSD